MKNRTNKNKKEINEKTQTNTKKKSIRIPFLLTVSFAWQ
jgi:hypothetical protein